MTLFRVVLRLLMCIALVANGAGAAQASARMAFVDAQHRAEQRHASQRPVDAPSCHMHGASAASATADMHGASHVATAGDDATSGHTRVPAGPDCCKGDTCACTCVQHASCEDVRPGVPDARVLAMPQPRALRIAHAQPRLPHLIRPPIG